MELFSINCTTCRARLKVREQSAIGQIVNCPKCGCMLQIAAPPGWQPPKVQAPSAAAPANEPAQAVAAMLAAAQTGAHWSSATTAPGSAPAASFAPPMSAASAAEGQFVDPQAVRVEVLAAAVVSPAALPAKPSAWLPVAKECVAAWLPWACVPLSGMLSAWLVGYCLRGEPPADSALGPPASGGNIAAAGVPLATPTAPPSVNDQPSVNNQPAVAATASPVPHTTLANGPSQQPAASTSPATIESQPPINQSNTAGGEAQPPHITMRPITTTLDPESASRVPASTAQAPAPIAAPAPMPALVPPQVAARSKPALPSSIEQPPVDVTQSLTTHIASLDLPSIPLLGFVELVGGLSGAPLTLDADACRELGIKLDTPLAVHEHDVSLAELLKHVLEPHALMAEVVRGQLVVTATAAHRHQLQSVRYSVSDLNDTPTALAGWIEQLAEPQRWIGQGGAGRVDVDGPQLVVLQTPRVQHEVLLLLDKLRLARGKPAVGGLDAFEVSLESPARQLAPQLDTKVSANFRHPAELEAVVRDLTQPAGVRLLVDWQSLAAAECRPHTLVSLVVDQQPLAAALDQLLRPLELSYRVVAADTLEVASIRALRARPELEVYPVRELPGAGGTRPTAEVIGQWLASRLPDIAWGGGAAWRFDGQSSCLFVRHDAMSQRSIEAALLSNADDAAAARENISTANPASGQP